MFIFIDGFQNVGKTTLIKNSGYNDYRFGFVKYLDIFNLKDKNSLNGFQIGKDLGMLYLSDFCFKDKDIILDRGPLSTFYYSIKENRWKNESYINNYLKEVSNFKNIRFIWVTKINDKEHIRRNKNDGFDFINDDNENYENRIKDLKNYCNKYNIRFDVFENDYSKTIVENCMRFKKIIKL